MKQYSKLFSIGVVISGVLLTDCSKKSDPIPTQASLVIGTWHEVSDEMTGCNFAADNYPKSNCASPDCTTAVFTKTTLKFTQSGSPDSDFTYTIAGDTLKLTPAPFEGFIGRFLVSGSTLTVTTTSQNPNINAGCKEVLILKKQ